MFFTPQAPSSGQRSCTILVMALLFSLVSCNKVRQPIPHPSVVGQAPQVTMYEWNGDDVKGPMSIHINVDEQKAYLKKGGTPVGWTYVATGLHSHPTPTGSFRIQEKIVDKYSNIWGRIYDAEGNVIESDARAGRDKVPKGGKFVGANMPYWMRLTGGGIGMHIGYIPNPGSRASHGCIRMPADITPTIFSHVVIGTPVTISGSGPRYSAPDKPSRPAARPSETRPYEPSPYTPQNYYKPKYTQTPPKVTLGNLVETLKTMPDP